MHEKDESGKEILKYTNFSVNDLITARDSFNERIRILEERNWLNKLQNKIKINIRKIIFTIFIIFLIAISIGSSYIMYLSWSDHSSIEIDKIFKYFPFFFIPIMVLAMVMEFGNDGASKLRKELSFLNIVLSKKQSNQSRNILMDTNVTDAVVSGDLNLEDFKMLKKKGYTFYITHIQTDEIASCPDQEKRAKLLLFQSTIEPKITPTESLVLGVSREGFSKTGTGVILEKIRNNNSDSKHTNDALIGETAIRNNFTLLSNDSRLVSQVKKLGGLTISFEEFRNLIKKEK